MGLLQSWLCRLLTRLLPLMLLSMRVVFCHSGLSVGERVLKADYHGAIFTVIRSRSPTHVGQRGILIQETQETFVIVSPTNAVKVLPKRDTIFSFSLPNANGQPNAPPQVFELYGDHLCFRSYERSARKFKAKATIEL